MKMETKMGGTRVSLHPLTIVAISGAIRSV